MIDKRNKIKNASENIEVTLIITFGDFIKKNK